MTIRLRNLQIISKGLYTKVWKVHINVLVTENYLFFSCLLDEGNCQLFLILSQGQ